MGYGRGVGQLRISVRPAQPAELMGAEELLERLDLPDAALENLCRLARLDEAPFRDADAPEGEAGWTARVELDGSALLLQARGTRWTIYAAPGESDGMAAARRLHGLIGEQSEGWDLDR
jgi:hypothetical protein